MYTQPSTVRPQTAVCTFAPPTELPQRPRPLSIAHFRKTTIMHFPRHRRAPSSGLRPDSFDSTNTATTYRSFISSTPSHRKRKILSKMKQLFRSKERPNTLVVLRRVSQKPSTLDFRCIGMNDSRLDMGVFTAPVYGRREEEEAPKIEVELPGEVEAGKWGRGWFEGIC